MYHDDHHPPHFHARYSGQEIQVGIADGRVKGKFPPRAKALVLEWWNLHREELESNWQLLVDGKEPNPIAPLE